MIRMLFQYILGESYYGDSDMLRRINYTIIICFYIFSFGMLWFLPPEIPMQYAADGSVNYTLPSIIGIWIPPTIILVVNILSIKKNKTNVLSTIVYLGVSVFIGYTYFKIL